MSELGDRLPSVAAIDAGTAPMRLRPSNYPEPYASQMSGREKRPLGEMFGLKNFGVNLTSVQPGAVSALLHKHSRQDEWVYVVEGELTLVTETGETLLMPGMCAGFPAGGVAHQLINRSDRVAAYLEVGDRTSGDTVVYPGDDLTAALSAEGQWVFSHRDGRPY